MPKILSWEKINLKLRDTGFHIVSPKEALEDALSLLEISCQAGHTYPRRIGPFLSKVACKICKNNSRRLPWLDIIARYEKDGFSVHSLETDYVNMDSVIKVVCQNGHAYNSKIKTFMDKNRCKKCGYENRTLSWEDVVKSFTDKAYEVLSSPQDYKKSTSRVRVRCPRGHEYSPFVNVFRRGHGCNDCASFDQRLPWSEVLNRVENRGFTLLTRESEYLDTGSKFTFLCPNGHEWQSTMNNFSSGNGCMTCGGKTAIPFSAIKEMFEGRGYKLLTLENEYKGGILSMVQTECPNGHTYQVVVNSFKRGCRCQKCTTRVTADAKITPLEIVQAAFSKEGYSIVSPETDYSHKGSSLDVLCPKGHSWTITPQAFSAGIRCSHCKWKGEELTRGVFETVFQKDFPRQRPSFLINPETGRKLELDGYCPQLNLAFEYMGLHRKRKVALPHWAKKDAVEKTLKRDEIKKRLCVEAGIRLVLIWEFDTRNQVKFANYVRDCLQKEIPDILPL